MWSSGLHRQLWQSATRNISTTSIVAVSHYDVLGIHPKATQAEVKAAYYKLSKLHHPDTTNQKADGGDKFRLITEAYEVLGNYKTRQMYDRGLYGHSGRVVYEKKQATPDSPEAAFLRSRFNKERVPTKSKESIYNFDEWTRQHYSNTFSNSLKGHKKKRTTMDDQELQIGDNDNALILTAMSAVSVILAFFMISSLMDTDNPQRIDDVRNQNMGKVD